MHHQSGSKISAQRSCHYIAGRSVVATTLFALTILSGAAWADAISLVNISRNGVLGGSVVPQVKVNPHNPNVVAVAWRRYGLPIDTNADKNARIADCHVSVSLDSGDPFKTRI